MNSQSDSKTQTQHQGSDAAGPNLLDNPLVSAVFKSRLYPGVFQWLTVIVFGVIMFELLLGPVSAHDNAGTAWTWVLWWPLIPIIFLVLGRFWCAICPFATVSDVVQKYVGHNRRVPPFLKKYGIWVIDAAFVFITWADHVWGIVESPWGSGVLMLGLTTGVVATGALYGRRTWCRYLCFLGGLSGNYARTGMIALRATAEKCATCKVTACYKGTDEVPGCPLFEFPKTMDSNANCNLCGYCYKNCPNDSIRLTLRVPTKELWFIREPRFQEAFLAVVIMGIVFIQNITMLEVWQSILSWLERVTGTESYYVSFSITFAVAMAIPVLLLLGTSAVGKLVNGDTALRNFAKFGYAIIPLDVAGHVAHNLFHLLAEGKSVYFTTAALFGAEFHGVSAAFLTDETIRVLQMVLIDLGAIASLYTAYRIAKSSYANIGRTVAGFAPFGVLILLLAALNVWLFLLPMAMRM